MAGRISDPCPAGCDCHKPMSTLLKEAWEKLYSATGRAQKATEKLSAAMDKIENPPTRRRAAIEHARRQNGS